MITSPRPSRLREAWRSKAPEDALLRAVALGGGVLLLGSLWTQWGFDRVAEPDRPLTAWELYERSDLLLALIGLAACVAAALPGRALSAAARVATGLAALGGVFYATTTSDPGRGARIAVLAGLAVLGSGVLDRAQAWLLPEGVPGREAGATELAWRVARSSIVLGGILAILTYPTGPLTAEPGLDGSWIIGLHLAADQGLSFGGDVVFTYGPLGYLTVPRPVSAETFRAGIAYVTVMHVAFAIALVWVGRRTLGLGLGFLAALGAMIAMTFGIADDGTQFPLVTVMTVVALVALSRRPALRGAWLLLAAATLGAFAAFHGLIRLNSGLTVAVIGLALTYAVAAERRALALGTYVGGGLVGLVVFWVLAGQPLGDLPRYLTLSAEIIGGFADGLSREDPSRLWDYVLVPGMIALLVWSVWRTTVAWPRPARLVAAAMLALVTFSFFKQGFVRHDAHVVVWYLGIAIVLVGLPWRASGLRLEGVFAISVAALLWLAAINPLPRDLLHTPESREALVQRLGWALDPQPAVDAAREGMRASVEVDPRMVADLRGRTFHVWPIATSVAWTLTDATWRPLPVFQDYVAYTDRLADLNGDAMRGADAPERILRGPSEDQLLDPDATYELACRYAIAIPAGSGRAQLLTRIPSRCGRERLLRRVTAPRSETIPVPAARPDEMIYVRVHGLEQRFGERLRGLLWKPYGRFLFLEDEAVRITSELADNRTLIAIPPAYDHPAPYAIARPVDSVRAEVATQGVIGPPEAVPGEATYEFYAVPLSRPVTGGAAR